MKKTRSEASVSEEKRLVAEMILKNGGSPTVHNLFATREGLKGVPLRNLGVPEAWKKVRSLSEYVDSAVSGYQGEIGFSLRVASEPNLPEPRLDRTAYGLGSFRTHLRDFELLCTGSSRVEVM